MKKGNLGKRRLSLNKRVIAILQDNQLYSLKGGTITLDSDVKKGCIPSVGPCDLTSNIAQTCSCPPKTKTSNIIGTCPTQTN